MQGFSESSVGYRTLTKHSYERFFFPNLTQWDVWQLFIFDCALGFLHLCNGTPPKPWGFGDKSPKTSKKRFTGHISSLFVRQLPGLSNSNYFISGCTFGLLACVTLPRCVWILRSLPAPTRFTRCIDLPRFTRCIDLPRSVILLTSPDGFRWSWRVVAV